MICEKTGVNCTYYHCGEFGCAKVSPAELAERAELAAMLAAVDRLAADMKDKLREKAAQGYSGGLDPQYADKVRASLKRHVVSLTGDNYLPPKPDPAQAVDVCNLALMLWMQGNNAADGTAKP